MIQGRFTERSSDRRQYPRCFIGGPSLKSHNQSVYIPLKTAHRLENPEKEPLKIIEVQTGAYLEEDDIIRLDDDYWRPEKS